MHNLIQQTMATTGLPSILIFIIVYKTANIEGSGSEIFSSSSTKSCPCEHKSNQDNVAERYPNILDVQLEIGSGGASFNLKSIVNGEIKSWQKNHIKGVNVSEVEDREGKSPVVARSTNADFEKNNLAAKLDYLAGELKTVEKALKDLQDENKKSSGKGFESCLRKTSLGVHHNSCNKSLKRQEVYPRNCKEIQKNGHNVTGIYEIYPRGSNEPFFVLCDMETKGGGWIHIQKRFDGSQDFSLGWRDYKFGFGDLEGEFWLGLQNIYLLAGFEPTELLVEIVDRDNVSAYAHYTSFAIGPEPGGYKLDRLAGFSGDAGDSLTYNLGQKFSTKDLDFTDNCVGKYPGGWWFKVCHISHLNGKYINLDIPPKFVYQGLHWKTFRSHEYCHSKSRMLVRPVT